MSVPTDCAICYEPVSLATGYATMACNHSFHFKCLSSWFARQVEEARTQSCPCCRREASEHEALVESEGDESEADEEDEEEVLCMLKYELDEVLKSLGGVGVSAAMWRYVFPGTAEEFQEGCAVTFSRDDIDNYAQLQGGRCFTDAEWEMLATRFGLRESEAAPDAPPPAAGGAAQAPAHISIDLSALPPPQVRWRRMPSGVWVRQILNPEEDESTEPLTWGEASAAPPPESLVQITMEAARKLQAVWRGYSVRRARSS